MNILGSSDKLVLEALEKITKLRNEIKRIETPSFNTDCSFSYDNTNRRDSTNLRVLDLNQLIQIVGFLTTKKNEFDNAVKLLTLETKPTFKWLNYSYDDWFNDLNALVGKVQLSAKKARLVELEKRTNAIISPELRTKMELEAISKELESM